MDSTRNERDLADVLTAARDLALRSRQHGWPDEDPSEAVRVLDRMLAHLDDRSRPAPPFACIQFAPTGPLQEIAMANGWHDAYLELADRFDRLAARLHLFQPGA